MNHYAALNLVKNPEVSSKTRSESHTKIIRVLMMAAIAGIVALAIIAQARVTPDDGLATFVNCCSRV